MNKNSTHSVVHQDRPIPNTHLTELQLRDMWYDYCDSVGNELPRKIGYLFPRSRKDLIQYFTKKDLANKNAD